MEAAEPELEAGANQASHNVSVNNRLTSRAVANFAIDLK
jgi:hypothetical protein